MTDHFALLGVARRPWLDPDELKEKYFALSRTAMPGAELNEAFRVLSDPKLRLAHLLKLEGADLTAGRPVPPAVAELFWNGGALLREVERWLLRKAGVSSTLAAALLQPEREKLAARLEQMAKDLRALHEAELEQLREAGSELAPLIEQYDRISYLTRLREQIGEKQLQLTLA